MRSHVLKVLDRLSSTRARWLNKPINSGYYHHWLIDGGSLTSRLQRASKRFAVKPIYVHYAKPYEDEVALLNLKKSKLALVRDVHLISNGTPVVVAHSILPRNSMRGRWHGLGRLGNKPLGGALFTNPKVMRTPLAYKKLLPHHDLYALVAQSIDVVPSFLWARRSIFKLNTAVILVTEIFLPEVLAL